jgi:hypoxanthine phosphoribosyltransferase
MNDYHNPMHRDISRVLISQYQIGARVREMAQQITDDWQRDGDDDITIIPILTGAMIFCGDLIRHMPVQLKIGLLAVSSYPGASLRTQGSQIVSQQVGDIHGRHVLLLDDILDSGGTLKLVVPAMQELGAEKVRTCVMLRKNRPEAKAVQVDYVGFDIPDEFVVGYGLDYNNYYRNLPDIVTLTGEAIERHK